jgi:hypothetical protein
MLFRKVSYAWPRARPPKIDHGCGCQVGDPAPPISGSIRFVGVRPGIPRYDPVLSRFVGGRPIMGHMSLVSSITDSDHPRDVLGYCV